MKRQIGMEAADNVEFRYRLAVSGSGSFECFIQGHGIGAGGIFLAPECAQTARRNANIRRIDVAIYVEISLVPVDSFANVIGEPADRKNIACTIER